MMVILLTATGALFALLFIVNSLLRAAQGRETVSFFETLLAFLALILPLLALVNNNTSEQPLALVSMAAIGIAASIIIAGIVTLLVERRRPGRSLNQRFSVLEIGVGALLIAAMFMVPVAPRLIPSLSAAPGTVSSAALPDSEILNTRGVIGGGTAPENPVALAPTHTSTPVLQLSATPTRLPSATPTPTNTPYLLLSPTPGTTTDTADIETGTTEDTTPLPASDCWALVNYNLNLRAGPGRDYSRILTIPFATTVNVSGRNQDSTWWFVAYDAGTGWVDGQYITLTGGCSDLPVQQASSDVR